MRLDFTTRALLCLSLTVAVIARPSPEGDAGYSYRPPPGGVRYNYQPTWSSVSPESRTRASEVTVEQVPIRLVQQSSELNRQPPVPPPPNRGAYYFPSARSQQHQQPMEYFRAEHASQINRGSYLPTGPNNYQQNGYNRNNEHPQQRGAYVFPPQDQNYRAPQYERPQHARNFNQGPPVNNYNAFTNNFNANNFRNNPPANNYNFNPVNNFNPTLRNNYAAPSNNAPYNHNSYLPNPAPTNNYPSTGFPQNSPATNNNYQPTSTNGYSYTPPSNQAPADEAGVTTTENTPTNTTEFGPRISIAISKSTVIHTGKGSYKIDEKTGLPQPLIAEAHSYATLPNDNGKSNASAIPGDNLRGEGTGSFPIIARGTPPEGEEDENTDENGTEENETEANTEEPTTEPPREQPTTPLPTPQGAQVPLYSSSWPLKSYGGHHAHVVVAPGQTQYFSIGTSKPAYQAHYFSPTVATPQYYVQPSGPAQYYTQPVVPYAQQYGAYHPNDLARSSSLRWPFAGYFPIIIRDPFASMYSALNSIIEYGPEADVCRGKAAEAPTEAAGAQGPVEDRGVEPGQDLDSQQQPAQQHEVSGRRVVDHGGVAIAGPGGVAEAGRGGTAIVGPGGTSYSSPNGVSVVGPGGKVLLQGANSETILAKGPVIYYHNG